MHPGITKEMVPELLSRFSDEQLQLMSSRPPQVGNFFPNGLFEFIYLPTADGKVTGKEALRMERAQDKASRRIAHNKHDRQHRPMR